MRSTRNIHLFSYVGVDRSKKIKIQEGLDRLEREEKELKQRNKTDFDDEVEKLLKKEGITRNIDRKEWRESSRNRNKKEGWRILPIVQRF